MALVCGSGGESAISADLCKLSGINCPDFSQDTKKALASILPDYATANNPLDTTASVIENVDAYESALHLVGKDPNVDLIVVGLPIYKEMRRDTDIMVTAIERYMHSGNGVPVVAVPNIESDRVPEIIERLRRVGVPLMPSSKLAFIALRKVLEYALWKETYPMRTLTAALPTLSMTTRKALSETKSKDLLREYGISIPTEYVVENVTDALRHAQEIGFPVVLKIESDEILHKSDVGGVIINIKTSDQLQAAYGSILENVHLHCPQSKINGILVQKMLPKGLEMIVGIKNDPQFGPLLLLGLGGVFTEVFKDVAVYPCPICREEAMMMIDSLQSAKLLYGYRGEKKCDINALADTMVSISNMAAAKKDELLELDINPIFVYEEGQGVGIADALAVLGSE